MILSARRTDQASGVVEEASFSGDGLFGVLHAPAGGASAGVVICPTVLAESLSTYESEVALARELASSGVAVYRFHYRGTGHSEGESAQLSLATMRDDAAAAADHLAAELGLSTVSFLGTRLGAFAAVGAAGSHDAAPVVLWEPVLSGRRYLREAWRASIMFKLREHGDPEPETLTDALSRAGRVDVLGYPLDESLYRSVLTSTLLDSATPGRRRSLLLHGPATAELEESASDLRRRGWDIELQALAESPAWWFMGPNDRRAARPLVRQLLDHTSAWLLRVLRERVPS